MVADFVVLGMVSAAVAWLVVVTAECFVNLFDREGDE